MPLTTNTYRHAVTKVALRYLAEGKTGVQLVAALQHDPSIRGREFKARPTYLFWSSDEGRALRAQGHDKIPSDQMLKTSVRP